MMKAFKSFHGRKQHHVAPRGLPTVAAPDQETPEFLTVDKSTECHVTPADIAGHMVDYLNLEPEHSVLEPSCGTGRLLQAVLDAGHDNGLITAVELNHALFEAVNSRFDVTVLHDDFLDISGQTFDRIVMNPPYSKGQAMRHVLHAESLLKPEGELIAIVPANFSYGYTIETLEPGVFVSTGISTKIIGIDNCK